MKKVIRTAAIFTCALCMILCLIQLRNGESETVSAAVTQEDHDPGEDTLLSGKLESLSDTGLQITKAANTSTSSDLTIKTYGIDVSKYQGDIDWEKVKAAGVTFAFVRVGYRGSTYGTITEDPYAVANIEGALAVGIEVGVYFFSTALTEEEALEEAEFVLDIIDGYDISYPVVYDCEGYENSSYRNYGTSNAVRTANAIAFLNYIEMNGYDGMMYGSSSHLKDDNSWETSTLEKYYDIWVAQYPYYTYTSSSNYTLYPSYSSISGKTTTYTGSYRFWQFSSQGSIDGISGYVDLDIEYVTEEDEDETILNGWVTDESGYKYYYVNDVAQTGFCTINGSTYYFNKSGQLQYGWRTISGSKYFFDRTTGVMQTGLTQIDSTHTYYFSESGKLQYGWRTIDGSKYFFSRTTGVMQTGLTQIDSTHTYYFSSNGVMQKGWKTINGYKYYFSGSTGVMQTGLVTISSKKYYFNTNGVMHTGWRTVNGSKYYFSKSTGAALTGFKTVDGKKYYFNTSGTMHKGWRTINGNKYYFSKSTGVMLSDGWATISGKKYYFNPSGRLHYGWRTIDGYKYYCDPKTGVMQTGWVTINGKKYYFYSNGKLKTS